MAELATFRLHAGDPAPPFSLPGVDGKKWSLPDFKDSSFLVVTFWCNHCPYVQAWEGRTIALQKEFAPKGVRFVLINANDDQSYPEDRFERMVARAKEKGYPFPYLRDESQGVARAYGALVTPHFMLFGPDRKLLFQGRIDDNYSEPDRVKRRFLRDALEAATTGRPIPEPELPVLGCSVKWRS